MLISALLVSAGLFILIKGANWLVDGASSISLKFRISPIVIGLTVVAFGTSTPELVVSITSALSGNTDIAFGNVVGSNIANVLLILGLSATIFPLTVQKNTVWKEIPMSFLAALILTILGFQDLIDKGAFLKLFEQSQPVVGSLTFSNGLVLLAFFVIFIYYTFGISKVGDESDSTVKEFSMSKSLILILIGLIALIVGSKLTVDNAITLAKLWNVSDAFIGLTLVALGTSLPELVTSVVAALKKNADIAVGNVVGSNIFNIFLILGFTSLVRPIPINAAAITDILVLFAATLLLFGSLFVWKKHSLGRIEGIFMVIAYLVYIGFLLVRG